MVRMGAAPDQLDVIADLHAKGLLPSGAAIADLGCTQLRGAGPNDVRRFFDLLRKPVAEKEIDRLAAHNTFITEHLSAAGFRYRAFDIVEAPDCEWFDLNKDTVSARWWWGFDLVLNFGTTEHVLNQYNAMRALHDFAKVGGLIYSMFIRGQSMDHGLLHYSDRFVDLLIAANGYETIWRDDNNGCTWIVMRKASDQPFRAVIDVQEGDDFPPLVSPPDRPLK